MVDKDISTIKKKTSILHRSKKCLEVIPGMTTLHPSQAQSCKILHSFDSLFFEKRDPRCSVLIGPPWEVFPMIFFTVSTHIGTQNPLPPWFQGAKLLISLAVDFDVVHVVLIL